MKFYSALTALTVFAVKASAFCWSESLGYQCCKTTSAVVYTDESGKWGVENGDWCGIPTVDDSNCWSEKLGYPCCRTTSVVVYTDESGKWGVENNNWCGIKNSVQPQPQPQPQPTPQPVTPVNKYPYSLKNDPVPSKGCGKNPTVKTGSFQFQWGNNQRRLVRVDLPQNYDNKHPYRLIFGMMCMGGSSQNVVNEGYYGLKPLDTGRTTIFVAPEGNGQQLPWGEADYRLFDELLAHLKNDLCIDESRVFSTGFSYGAMFSNGLSWNHQEELRAVAVYETAAVNIWLPKNSGKAIGWMGVLGFDDNVCTPAMGRDARDKILMNNSEGGKAKNERAEEAQRGGAHKCYDYKTVDPRFPVRWCTQSGGHMWDHRDPGQGRSWVPQATWEFFSQF